MADDRTGLLSGSRPTAPSSSVPPPTGSSSSAEAVYHDSSQSPTARLIQLLFVALVVVMVMVSLILSVYRGVEVEASGGSYLLLGISLIGFVAIETLMIVFTRRGDLPKGKTWFLYFVGFCILLESIFTDVLLYQ